MRIAFLAPLAAAAILAGCAGAGPTAAPAAVTPDFNPVAKAIQTAPNAYEFNGGVYHLHIDANNLTASVTPAHRSNEFNGDLFYLNVNQFFGNHPVTLRGLELLGSTLTFKYAVKHPFPAPSDVDGTPNGSTNRADLGICGRVLLLAGIDSTTLTGTDADPNYAPDYVFDFGSGDIQKFNTKILLNPAGYYDPAGMLDAADTPAGDATGYPFQQLIDEMDMQGGATVVGSRNGVSNGGNSHGNYDPNAGGWQGANIGAGNKGWTGYGMLHQGQETWNQMYLDIDQFPGGELDLNFALIASYTDPRQGGSANELRSHRLPRTNDPSKFAYYMPHGAVDIERVRCLLSDATIPPSNATQEVVDALVTDQDSAAAVDPEFPGQGGIRLDEIPGVSQILSATATSTEIGYAADPGLIGLGDGSGELPVDISWFVTNNLSTFGGVDSACYVGFKIVDAQSADDAGLTLNNASPPTPVAAGQEQTSIVYQVLRALIG
ncbi:MAG: hypothetical protein ABI743_11245 [bacterium]